MKYLFTIFLFLSIAPVNAQFYHPGSPLAHTYSIVARDPDTGEMAVAVQSHWFSVGSSVAWAEAGVGAIATQSFINESYGPRGLELLKSGKSAMEVLEILVGEDEGRDFRQVAIVDSKGEIANYTGASCIAMAGMRQGKGYSVQANMMLTEIVWDAMAASFENSKGRPLAERMVLALEAAQGTGGDIRGKQSAALIVVSGDPDTNPWDDPLIELRVDDHPDPVAELQRLLKVYRAYEHMSRGDLALEKNDMKLALAEYNAAQQMFPENLEMKYWTAVTLANSDRVSEALPLFSFVFSRDKNWIELTRRISANGLLTVSKDALDRILSSAE